MNQPKDFATIARIHPALANKIQSQQFFLDQNDINTLAKHPNTRSLLVLVRCGAGRFLAPADTVHHFATIIGEHATLKAEKDNTEFAGDYIRDYSLPA